MPRLKVKCNRFSHEFLAGDFLPLSKTKCPKRKNIGATRVGKKSTPTFDIMDASKKAL